MGTIRRIVPLLLIAAGVAICSPYRTECSLGADAIQVSEEEPVVLHGFILKTLLVLTLLALVPARVKIRKKVWFHFIPLLALPLYLWYEWTMPSRFNIRVDLLFIFPALLVCVASFIIKFYILKASGPQMSTVLSGGLLVGAGAFGVGFVSQGILTPDAAPGPFLGVFVIGVLGFLLGSVSGFVYWRLKRRRGEARTGV